jgi:hypothetical protein
MPVNEHTKLHARARVNPFFAMIQTIASAILALFKAIPARSPACKRKWPASAKQPPRHAALRKTPPLMKRLTAISLLVALAFAGCTTPVRHDNAARLIARPDFDAARAATPEWCRDALKTINALEYELERR